MMIEKIYHYPLWIRLWHWINALLCLALIISGISMQFSEPDRPIFRFDIAVTMHNISAVLLSVNYLFFLIGNRFTGNSKHYRITEPNFPQRMLKQFLYYMAGIFKGEPAPFPITKERKFNPLQQFSYMLIMYGCLPLIFVTGWGLFFPETIIPTIFGISGIFLTDLIHIITGFTVSMFMIIHVYFCTMGTKMSSLFKGMINGWAEAH
jgi:thiosulfate reductase cytochrome b subunit